MFCPQCGKENFSNNTVCENCGAPLWSENAPQQPQQQPVAGQPQAPATPAQPPVDSYYGQQPYNAVPPPSYQAYQQPPYAPVPPQQPLPHVPNYLAWSIICIFLCWPLAIPGIVYSSRVNNLLAMGDFNGAMQASKNAKTFDLIATILGVVVIIFTIIGNVMGSLAYLY